MPAAKQPESWLKERWRTLEVEFRGGFGEVGIGVEDGDSSESRGIRV